MRMNPLRILSLEECAMDTVQPFRELLDGTLADRMWLEEEMASAGCHKIGCPNAWAEQSYYGDWDAGCEGFVSETAAQSCYEQFNEWGARSCRLYQIQVQGKRCPDGADSSPS